MVSAPVLPLVAVWIVTTLVENPVLSAYCKLTLPVWPVVRLIVEVISTDAFTSVSRVVEGWREVFTARDGFENKRGFNMNAPTEGIMISLSERERLKLVLAQDRIIVRRELFKSALESGRLTETVPEVVPKLLPDALKSNKAVESDELLLIDKLVT